MWPTPCQYPYSSWQCCIDLDPVGWISSKWHERWKSKILQLQPLMTNWANFFIKWCTNFFIKWDHKGISDQHGVYHLFADLYRCLWILHSGKCNVQRPDSNMSNVHIQIKAVTIFVMIFGAHRKILYITDVKILKLFKWSYKNPIILIIGPRILSILWACNFSCTHVFLISYLGATPNHM
jgi:hypothetical protein